MKMNEKLDIMLSRRHLKRVEFAESIGITYRAFAYYMTGSRKPRKSVLEKMAAKLEVTPEFLLDDSIDMELTTEEKFISGISSNGGSTTDAVKFLAQLVVGVEQSADCACARFRAARFYAARRHAAMFTLNYYDYVLSFAYLLNNIRNVGANSLL